MRLLSKTALFYLINLEWKNIVFGHFTSDTEEVYYNGFMNQIVEVLQNSNKSVSVQLKTREINENGM